MSKRVQYALSVPSLPVAPNTEADRVLIYAKGGGFYYRRPDGAEVGPLASQAEAAAVPSNMVTTDTDQTITGLKTFNNELHAINSRPIGTWGGGPFDEDKAHAYIYPSMLQIGSRMATAVDHPSGSSTTADIIFYGHRWDPDRNAGAGGDQRDIGNIWFQYAPELSDFRFEVSHALEVPQLYEGINRVLTTASTLPAPSNMVTTDTDQELSAGKTFGPTAPTGWAGSQPLRFRSRSLDNPANPTLFDVTLAADYNFHFTQSNPDAFFAFNTSGGYNAGQISLNPASGDVHLAAPRASADNPDSTASIRLVPSTWTGGGSQSHEVFLGARATLLDGTPGSLLVLQPQQTQVIGELYEGTNRVYSANNLPPAPSNMVTTDTAQTISGAKTFLDHTYFSGSTSAADLFVRDPSGPPWSQQTYIGQSYIQLMDNGSKTETTIYPDAGLLLKGPPATATGPAPWGPYVGARPQFWNGTSSQAVNAGFEWTATSTTTALVTATRSAFRADGAIYEGVNRVYSAANLPPAPSNMVTTDTEQTISGRKKFSSYLSVLGSDPYAYVDIYTNQISIGASAATAGAPAQDAILELAPTYWGGTTATYAPIFLTGSAPGGDRRLQVNAPIYEGENRVYSPNNKVPIAGLSATGTASTTTFLRGDNTWASVTAAAPSNMVTTDTWQEITGAKRFAGGPQTAVASFSSTSYPSVNNTSVNSPALQFSPTSLNNDVETSHNILLYGRVNGDGTRARLYTTGQLEATELWEGSERVYSANNKVPVSGLSATGTASSATFLRGDNTWSTPATGKWWETIPPSKGAVTNNFTRATAALITEDGVYDYDWSSRQGMGDTDPGPGAWFRVRNDTNVEQIFTLDTVLSADDPVIGGEFDSRIEVYLSLADGGTFLYAEDDNQERAHTQPLGDTVYASVIHFYVFPGTERLVWVGAYNYRDNIARRGRLRVLTRPSAEAHAFYATPATSTIANGQAMVWSVAEQRFRPETVYSINNKVPPTGLSATGTASSATFLRGDNTWATLTAPAPSNMVTTDTEQTISVRKKFTGGASSARVDLTPEVMATAGATSITGPAAAFTSRYWDGSASVEATGYIYAESQSATGAGQRLRITPPGSSGVALVAGELRVTSDVSVSRVFDGFVDGAAGTLARVYSPNNKVPVSGMSATGTASSTTFLRGDNTWAAPTVPAPSNMVTTDTNQEITGEKYFYSSSDETEPLVFLGGSSVTRRTPNLSFYVPITSTSTATVSLRGAADDSSGTNRRLEVRFGGLTAEQKIVATNGGVWENASRVYSPNNKVPIAGLSATGTPSSATFLRGDDTWATPAAPSNMVTTDTTQTITGAKMFRGSDPWNEPLAVMGPSATSGTTTTEARLAFYPYRWSNGSSTSANFFLTATTTADGLTQTLDVNNAWFSAKRVTALSGGVYDGSNRVYSAGNAPPAPTNMVTTDTTQSISGAKTLNGASQAAVLALYPTTVPGANNTAVDSSALRFQMRQKDGTGALSTYNIDMWGIVDGDGTNSRVYVNGQFRAGNIYDSGQRVYSSNNKVPIAGLSATGTASSTTFLRGDNTWATPAAPSNMMTTDTAQTLTGDKTWTYDGTVLTLMRATSASAGATLLNSPTLRFRPSYWTGSSATNPAVSLWASAEDTAGTVALRTNARFYAQGGLYDGAEDTSRVYSANNKVPASGMSATGTADSTTFLRGDNTWAAPPAGISPTLVDAKGDLIVATANDAVARQPVGTDGHVLVADTTSATGVKWASPSALSTGAGYATIQDEGTSQAQRATLNFIGATVTAADDLVNLRTNVTVDAAPTIHTHAAGDINSGTLGTARLGSGTASSTTFLRGDQTWATPAAPSNMVTTDTEQTISGVKTYSGLNTFKVSELRADESLRAMATGDTHSLLVQETSSTGTTALRVMLVRDKDSNGMLAISRSGPHVMWARPSATDLLEFRAFQGSSPVARVTAAGHLYGAQVYDNGNRVYSSGNAPPAPSNMVTTDTTQTISARKTLTAGAVLRAPDNLTDGLEVQSPDGSPVLRVSDKQVIVLSGSAPTTDGTQTSAQIGLRSNTRHGGGTTLQTSTLIYEAADMSTAAQAAATMRLRLTDGHLFEGSNRVYSAGNAPPAPSNMVTTDTIQSVTNTKYWTLNPGSTGALFRSNSPATSSSTLINSPTVELQGARWDGSTSVTQTAILQLVARSDTSRLTLLSADFAAPALYDNGQRVYSANNKVPVSGLNATGTASSTTFLGGDDTWATPAAPSNMVTTDSFQTITATKTFSGVVTIGGATNALDLSNPNEATSTFTTRSSRPIRFATRRWDGAASQNETVSVDAQRGSATAGNYWLNVDAPLRATELLDNGSRVFSPSNKVGTGGLSATGTADATTFLRGDNTWGTALTAAPSNMVTTDTAQTISGNKDFTGTVSRSGSALVDTTDARLSDARTPTTHTHAAGDTTSGTFDLARLPVAASGTSSATQVVRADDSRLSDSRTPTTHSHAIGDLPVAASGVISSTLLARSDDARLNDPRSLISVALATTGNITLSGVQTVDGYSTTGAIILVKDQTNAAENGTYSASDTGAWSRYHTSSSSYAAQILRIRQGTVNGGTVWATSFESTDTVGTTAMRYYRVPKLDSGSSTIPPAELGTGTRDGTKYLRDDGTWTAVAGGEASGSEISATTDYTNTTPASPISGLTLFSRHRARRLPAFVGPTGQDTRVQPHIATNNTMWVKAVNGTTAPTVHGMAATWLNAGTASPAAVSVATTNLYTSMIRTRAATPAAVNGGAGVRSATAQFMVSATANMGGFHYIARWGINVGASGTRGFMGMSNQAAAYAAGTNPSAQLNQIGFYWDAAQTTLRFIASGSAAGTGVDLGANFPVTVGATNFYECSIFVPSGLGQYGFWSATRINDGAFASGTFGTSGATALTTVPLPSVLLAAHVFYGSGTLATAQSIDIQSMYIETDN